MKGLKRFKERVKKVVMADTKIEWADKVWNPVTGCTPISEGCRNCYAKRMATRLAGRCGYSKDNPFEITFHLDRLNEPLRWKKPQRIFVCSMADLFHKDVSAHYIDKIIRIMHRASQHIYLLLSKRPENFKEYLHDALLFLPNVYLGVSVEDQKTADERIPLLLQTPAAKRFVSYEPALESVDFSPYFPKAIPPDHENGTGYMTPGIDWLIMGGESGPGARPMNPEWVQSARDQCQAAGVPFFFKQWGPWAMVNGIYKRLSRPSPDCLIDGREWKELPR